MKQCPVCRTTYTDESLRYCLSDGSPLVSDMSDQPTIVDRSVQAGQTAADRQPMRVDIPQTSQPVPVYQAAAAPTASSSGGIFKVLIVLLLLGLFVVIIAAAGVFIYMRSGTDRVGLDPRNDAKTPAPSPTKDDKDELRDQIANLEKMLNDQKKSNKTPNLPQNIPNQSAMTTTARVNSPGDGFLALRTLPNSELGDRILKIPHGAVISVGECGPVMTPVKRSGRWCQAMYNGYRGWVFDGYLIY